MAKNIFLICSLLLFSVLFSSYQPADINKRDKLKQVYTSQIGVLEKTGNNDGAEVMKYLSYCGAKEGTEWCSAFVSWCFNEAGIKTNIRSVWSPAWYNKSKLIYHAGWEKPVQLPQKGDVVLYYVPYKKRIGHVGFFDKYGTKYCETVEGNTGKGSMQGVHRIKRYWSSFYAILNYAGNE